MKRRILATAQALVLGCALLTACSKGKAAETSLETAEQRQARIAGSLDEVPKWPLPAPMPADTLELDSLDRPDTQ
ncbi:hypothetical protein [Flaviaesturariibacter amylovorans]|uniref:Sorbosone dehydrogenase family protein n=1 Tax=Flaviaesturariibacter amylovorans TaxID=1084520 RepID=A0ABP8HDI5_9BACT